MVNLATSQVQVGTIELPLFVRFQGEEIEVGTVSVPLNIASCSESSEGVTLRISTDG